MISSMRSYIYSTQVPKQSLLQSLHGPRITWPSLTLTLWIHSDSLSFYNCPYMESQYSDQKSVFRWVAVVVN
jgi:hypothetical protein